MKQRIQKVLAAAGVASRRNIEEMVLQGRIAINGKTIVQLPILVDPFKDKISIDDEPLKMDRRASQDRVYFLMYKPKGVYSTNVSQGEQMRAIDLLPPHVKERVYPVGRLDADSKGLLLLTNDGELANHLTHPRYGVAKTYRAVVDGYVTSEAVADLEKGVWMADAKTGKGFKTGRSRIKIVRKSNQQSILEITIREGRNRQVRRMLARLGNKVRDLTRIKMGPLTLDGLRPGDVRTLSPREVKQLRKIGKDQLEPTSPGADEMDQEIDPAARPVLSTKLSHSPAKLVRPSAKPGHSFAKPGHPSAKSGYASAKPLRGVARPSRSAGRSRTGPSDRRPSGRPPGR